MCAKCETPKNIKKIELSTNKKQENETIENILYYAEVPDDIIDANGVTEIIKILVQNIPEFDLVSTRAEFINNIKWQWQDKTGTLPKRIQKYFYKNFNKLKLDQKLVSEIGNIARSHSAKTKEYYFDFHNEICNWYRGDFGNANSCYWTEYNKSPGILQYYGSKTIRFFKPNKYGGYYNEFAGYGRAFILPIIIHNQECEILINGYGYDLLEIARMYSNFKGLSYIKVDLSCYSSDLYINGECGYLIADQNTCSNLSIHPARSRPEIELDYYEYEAVSWIETNYCSYCDYSTNDYFTDDNGNICCADCFHELYSYCNTCESPTYNEEIIVIDDNFYCSRCADRISSVCDECGHRTSNDKIFHTDFGYTYCESCFDALHTFCSCCDKIVSIDDAIEFNHAYYCNECYDENTQECAGCSEIILKENANYDNNKLYCAECYEIAETQIKLELEAQ